MYFEQIYLNEKGQVFDQMRLYILTVVLRNAYLANDTKAWEAAKAEIEAMGCTVRFDDKRRVHILTPSLSEVY